MSRRNPTNSDVVLLSSFDPPISRFDPGISSFDPPSSSFDPLPGSSSVRRVSSTRAYSTVSPLPGTALIFSTLALTRSLKARCMVDLEKGRCSTRSPGKIWCHVYSGSCFRFSLIQCSRLPRRTAATIPYFTASSTPKYTGFEDWACFRKWSSLKVNQFVRS